MRTGTLNSDIAVITWLIVIFPKKIKKGYFWWGYSSCYTM